MKAGHMQRMQVQLSFPPNHVTVDLWKRIHAGADSNGLDGRNGCVFTNESKLTRQNIRYRVFILSAMKYKSDVIHSLLRRSKEKSY
ncbi:hypothetical protein AOLI_G00008130 [Acnodon oligacanthus]